MQKITAEGVRDCLARHCHMLPETADTDLWENGHLDSLAFVNVIEELEATFSLDFQPTDLRVENFSTLNRIVDTLRKLAEPHSA